MSPETGFHPASMPLAFSAPRLVSLTSAWVQHIPFAFALVDLLRPSTIVELGVHAGDSYCAFCQAVDALQLECACTGIDTWLGDAQAGFYDESVYNDLRDHHDPLYNYFSSLLRTTFDEALPHVRDGSVDLLHHDGTHDYDSVRHDFDRWLPKVSDAGVVLIHDTQVRDRGFGVRQFWEEVRTRYPHFEFTHGYGLGMLLVGSNVPAPLAQFVDDANHSPETTRKLFASLGGRIELSRGSSRRIASLVSWIPGTGRLRRMLGRAGGVQARFS